MSIAAGLPIRLEIDPCPRICENAVHHLYVKHLIVQCSDESLQELSDRLSATYLRGDFKPVERPSM